MRGFVRGARGNTPRAAGAGREWLAVALLLAGSVGLLPAGSSPARAERRSSLVNLEGEVVAVGSYPGEGDISLLEVTVRRGDGELDEVKVLLGPEITMGELGFAVEPGDQVRMRAFVEEDGPLKVHKVQNISRGTLVRLRTLHQVPLWDTRGAWQGGPCCDSTTARGSRQYRGGRGSSGGGGSGRGSGR